MFRKIFCAVVSVCLVSLSAPLSARGAAATPAVDWDGTRFNETTVEQEGRLYLGLAPVCAKLGYTIAKSSDGKTLTLVNGPLSVTIDAAANQINENGHLVNVSAQSVEGGFGGGCVESGGQLCLEKSLMEDCFGLDIRWQKETASIHPVMENMLSVKTVRETSDTQILTTNIQYPQISSVDYPAACEKINTVFQQAAQKAVSEGQQEAQEFQKDGFDGSDGRRCEAYFDYDIRYNQHGLLSVVLTDYQYAGGAHGQTAQTAHTFDFRTGAEYSLGDLMRSPDYVKEVNALVRQQINARKVSEGLTELQGSEFKTISAKQDYYLSNQGIVVYFQQYEHFPYAAGIQEFAVQSSALRQKLKPAFSFL